MVPLFSVIIPVYNVEKYLDACIQSVLKQDCVDYEIILVDDGSKDSSGAICDKYTSLNPQIQVIHQKNAGLSMARNVGIEKAKGEYIVLLDSDDMLDDRALSVFEENISRTHADVYSGRVVRIYEQTEDKCQEFNDRIGFDEYMNGIDFLEKALSQNAWTAPAQSNVYYSKFLKTVGIPFKKGILHEDELWTPQIFLKAKKIVDVNYSFYIYRIRPNSITTTTKPKLKNAKHLIQTCEELQKICESYPSNRLKYFKDHLSMLYMSSVYMGRLDRRKEVIISRTFPIRNAYKFKNKIKAMIFLLSPKLYCGLDALIKK